MRFFSFSAGTAVVAAAAAVAAAVDCSCFAVMWLLQLLLLALLRVAGLMLRMLVVDSLGAKRFKDLQCIEKDRYRYREEMIIVGYDMRKFFIDRMSCKQSETLIVFLIITKRLKDLSEGFNLI